MFGGGEVCAYLPDTGIQETLLVIIHVAVYYVTGVVMFGGGEVCAYLPDTGIQETFRVIILMLMFTMLQVW